MIVTLNSSTSPRHNKTQQTTALLVHLAEFRLTLQTERFKVDTQSTFCQSPRYWIFLLQWRVPLVGAAPMARRATLVVKRTRRRSTQLVGQKQERRWRWGAAKQSMLIRSVLRAYPGHRHEQPRTPPPSPGSVFSTDGRQSSSLDQDWGTSEFPYREFDSFPAC